MRHSNSMVMVFDHQAVIDPRLDRTSLVSFNNKAPPCQTLGVVQCLKYSASTHSANQDAAKSERYIAKDWHWSVNAMGYKPRRVY